eukprot:gene16852-18551_t
MMLRSSFIFALVFCVLLLLVAVTDGKKSAKSKTSKDKKGQSVSVKSSVKTTKGDTKEEDKDLMQHEKTQLSLPATSVAQSALPAATKDTDESFSSSQSSQSGDQGSGGSGDEEEADSDEEAEEDDDEKPQKAVKPADVKSKVKVEKDKNKIAETVKKSIKGSVEKDKRNKITKNKATVESSNKRKKESKSEKEDKRTNQPKADYPTFDWKKNASKVSNATAKIPGWQDKANIPQMIALSQMAAGVPAVVQKDTMSLPVSKFFNGSINNQADIASLDQDSIEPTGHTTQKGKTQESAPEASSSKAPTPEASSSTSSAPEASSSTASAPDSTATTAKATEKSSSSDSKNPVADPVASDTGEVPQNISKTADVKVPSNIPNRCAGLVKMYSNGELTLMDYLKQLRRCKKADKEFNSAHPFASPAGNAMLRASISKNGAGLTKEAYKYALERMRNYVPSNKEKQAAEQILAKWRSNSFGDRVAGSNTDVPDAVKSFMGGQNALAEQIALKKKQNVETQTDKAIDTAEKFILGTITGRPSALDTATAASTDATKKAAVNTNASPVVAAGDAKAIVTNPNQSVTKVIAAAQALLGDASKGKAVVLTGGNANSLLASVVKKKSYILTPNAAALNKAKALEMAKNADKLNAALLSQISSSVLAQPVDSKTDLVAALKDMAPGPEAPVRLPLNVVSSVQKRSIVDGLGRESRRKKRSIDIHSLVKKSQNNKRRRMTRELVGKATRIDNPIERSKLNKPIMPAPKLMDRIRDMKRLGLGESCISGYSAAQELGASTHMCHAE